MESNPTTRRSVALIRRLAPVLMALAFVAAAVIPSAAQEHNPYEARRQKLMERRQRTLEQLTRRREEAAAYKKKLRDEFSIYRIETFNDGGDASRRLDVVFLSEGFRKDDYRDFAKASEAVAKYILDQDPFKSYRDYTNLHRIFVASDDSGVSSPGRNRKTALGGRVDEDDILAVDRKAAMRYMEFVSDCDLLVAVCNVKRARSTATWGGGGPPLVALATDQWGGHAGSTLIHELGHAFGFLADEYVDPVMSQRVNFEKPTAEVSYVNVSVGTDANTIKWHYWLGASGGYGGKVGAYRGAHYHSDWYVRPQKHCIMRCDSKSFCVVCMEQMIRRYYQYIDPIDSATPHETNLTIFRDDTLELEAKLVRVRGQGSATAVWFVDGKQEGTRDKLVLSARRLEPGDHQVLLYARYKDPRVRRDFGLMSSSRGWRVHVLDVDRPKMKVEDRVQARQGDTLKLPVSVEGGLPEGFRLEMLDVPEGATFDDKTGLAWTIPADVRGVLMPRVRLTGPRGTLIEQAVRITVRGQAPLAPNSSANTPPVYDREAEVEVSEGERLQIELSAYDADGDRLVYSCPSLPPGMTFDATTGRIDWPTGFSSGGVYQLNLSVTDGLSRASVMRLTVTVNDRGITDAKTLRDLAALFDARPTHDIYLALRSAHPRMRRSLFDLAEKRYPPDAVFAEMFRLCRDPDASVADEAFSRLKRRVEGDEPGGVRTMQLLIELLSGHLDDFMDMPDRLAAFGTWIESADKMDLDVRAKRSLRSLKSTHEKILRHNKKRGIK